MNKLLKIFFLVFLFVPIVVSANSSGTIDSTNKYAWSEQIGWINFAPTNGNVQVTDSGMTGHVWNSDEGWINLSPTQSGVIIDVDGNLSGYAWGESVGWIDFTGVSIDNEGYFHGYASGDLTGQINFNCENTSSCGTLDYKVQTSWAPPSTRGGIHKTLPPSSTTGGLDIMINGGDDVTTKQEVMLALSSSDNATEMSLSNNEDFSDAIRVPYQDSYKWVLSESYGSKIVYAKFFTVYGVESETISDSIEFVEQLTEQESGDDADILDKEKKEGEENMDESLSPDKPVPIDEPEDIPEVVQPTEPQPSFVLDRNLRMGDTGSDVKVLQKFLNEQGFVLVLSGPGSPGNETELFGLLTFKALILFQNANAEEILKPVGLEYGSGYCGPSTRAFINNTKTIKPVTVEPEAKQIETQVVLSRDLSLGSVGEDVKFLQQYLNKSGFNLTEDGPGSPGNETEFFGRLTHTALVEFQNAHSEEILKPVELEKGTGICGPSTRQYILKHL